MIDCTEDDVELLKVIEMVSPGTKLRVGLDYILKAKLGGLIVVENNNVKEICDGGFNIDKEYLPTYLYELSKMDGAIILSGDLKRILFANVNLVPDGKIFTNETGTRHQTAQRVAKQTKNPVISISQRRNVITLYKGECKYILRNINDIISNINQGLQTLEKYKSVFDMLITSISINEVENKFLYKQVLLLVEKAELIYDVMNELRIKVIELGNEGRFIRMELEEFSGNMYAKLDLVYDVMKKEEIVGIRDKFEDMYNYYNSCR